MGLLNVSKLGICESALSPQRVFGLAAKVGWTSSVPPSLRSRRKRRTFQSTPPFHREIRGVGVLPAWEPNDPAIFDQPQRLRRISLVFEERETARTQEFVLRWSTEGGSSVREIVRQQWNFSPPGSVREIEEYQVDLPGVGVLELIINPNIGGGLARASLKNLRLS